MQYTKLGRLHMTPTEWKLDCCVSPTGPGDAKQ